MMEFNKKLANLLMEGRKKLGLTQAELAECAGVSFRTYQRIESGEASPRIETALTLLQCLKIDAHEILLSFSPQNPEPPQAAQLLSLPFARDWSGSLRQRPLLLDPFTSEAIEAIKRTLLNEFEQGISHVGYWDWNLATGEFHWSVQMYSIYEVEIHPPPANNPLLERLHPEDARKLEQDIQRLVKHDIPYCNTHRVVTTDKTFLVRGSARKYVNSRSETLVFGVAERVS